MFHFVGFLITGFIVGLLARAIMPGRDRMGIVMTTILGIVGAVLAGILGRTFGWYGPGQNAGFVSSVIGAIILLGIGNAIKRHRHATRVPGSQKERDQNYPRRAA